MSETVLDYKGIESSCNNLKKLAESIRDASETLNDAIGSLPSEWSGDAGDNYYKEIKKFGENLPEAQKTIAMSVLFLASCADGYKSLDDKAYEELLDLVGGQEAIDATNVSNLSDVDLLSRITSQFAPKTEEASSLPTTEGTNQNYNPGGSYNSGGYYGSGGYASIPVVNASDATSQFSSPTPSNNDGSLLEEFKVDVPDSVEQGGFTVSGYDYDIETGEEKKWPEDTSQNTLKELWKKQGSRFKDGIAIVTIDGVDRLLVALSPKFGNAGDLVDIELSNGEVIKAVIADEKGKKDDYGEENEDGLTSIIEFQVKKDAVDPEDDSYGLKFDKDITVKTVTNNGAIVDSKGNVLGNMDNDNNVISANSSTKAAIDWAKSIADDPSHGYSRDNRQGPNYDCSSLVCNAYKNAGVNIAGASYTGNMREQLTSTGQFEWVSGDPYTSGANLKPGDILLKSDHTEMYYGDGKTIGAHSNYDGSSGDSSGREINIQSDTHKGQWAGYLRYVPKTKII